MQTHDCAKAVFVEGVVHRRLLQFCPLAYTYPDGFILSEFQEGNLSPLDFQSPLHRKIDVWVTASWESSLLSEYSPDWKCDHWGTLSTDKVRFSKTEVMQKQGL